MAIFEAHSFSRAEADASAAGSARACCVLVALAASLWLGGCGGDDSGASSGGAGGNGAQGGAAGSGAQSGSGGSSASGGASGFAGAGGKTDCSASTCYYLRADAPVGGDGTSWASAFSVFPDSPERGAVYLVGDGDYASLLLDAPESGQAAIAIRKATATDHGSDDGWNASYGDGQASFPDVTMVSDFWEIDGRTRDESDWQRVDAYGFRVPGGFTAHTINFGRGSKDVIIRFVDVGGPAGDNFDPSIPTEGFYFGGFDAILARWRISRSHIHNVYLPFQLAGASDVTIEHSWLGPNWSKETIRGQGHAARIVIRHNVFKDGCQGTPGDPTAPGCTAQVAMWDGDTVGDFDASEIYGNVIWTTKDTGHTDGCLLIGGDGGVSAAGVSANDVRIYNNTLVGVQNGTCSIRVPGSHTGVEVKNNAWFGLGSGVASDCAGDLCENNAVLSGTPFANVATGDFHLAGPTQPGSVLAPPYDVDPTGAKRGADGVWDLGAFEYQ
ncbi:MAG: hypothetical protein R3B13_00770 [Polyangiaceae bacterium]